MANGPRPPRLARLFRDRRGQTETLSVVLLLAITVAGTGTIVAYGSTAMTDTQRSADVQRAEHAMTLVDSRAAMVALGDASAESVALYGDGGDYEVRPDAGWLRIRHLNYSGEHDETIYNATLGEVVYERDDATVSYQGGGVWRTEDNGTTIVSPPEFHYRGETLTLPVVTLSGGSSAAGASRATVKSDGRARPVFPNPATGDGSEVGAPYNATDGRYANPLTKGVVRVTVHSDHYRGWAAYFRDRTEGNTTVHHANRTATLDLSVIGTAGEFRMPSPSDGPVKLRGLSGGHVVDDFNVTIADDESGSGFQSLSWSMYAEEDGAYLDLHLRHNGQPSCDSEDDVTASIYYDADTSDNYYQGWRNDTAFEIDCVGPDDDMYITANFTGEFNMTYTTLRNQDTRNQHSVSGSLRNPVTHEGHANADLEPRTFYAGSEAPISHVVNHYLAQLGPNVDLRTADKCSDGQGGCPPGTGGSVDEGRSSGTVEYDGGGENSITYLHVTENGVVVEFN